MNQQVEALNTKIRHEAAIAAMLAFDDRAERDETGRSN
jgi:hypothetical protein